ncbi:MAG: stress responsive alpha-beta barrel protein [Nocardioides sp.]|uniref:Dabb family protein n=1 Tax=Nocardioides sp. TaxID=35761 RepID=UPI002632B7A5|nr:Dabb family protein [Nocardioides sp.]MCW2834132.1 stress responsive alpha-beta barrel protein [Nocardioides sp.]
MTCHTVAFRLVHPSGSTEERDFLTAGRELATIPGVERFEQLVQTSTKNNFAFGFSMEFADAAANEAYNQHPVHTAFAQKRWVSEVADFLELDYEPLA